MANNYKNKNKNKQIYSLYFMEKLTDQIVAIVVLVEIIFNTMLLIENSI